MHDLKCGPPGNAMPLVPEREGPWTDRPSPFEWPSPETTVLDARRYDAAINNLLTARAWIEAGQLSDAKAAILAALQALGHAELTVGNR